MEILVLNGNPDPGHASFDTYLADLRLSLESRGHACSIVTLRDLKLSACTGCFSCFSRTPGVCIFRDDGVFVLKHYINSNLALFASPLIMGFPSALLKRMQDRLLPYLLPDFYLFRKKVHHPPRYERLPKIGLLLDIAHHNHLQTDADLAFESFRNMSDDFATELVFAGTTSQSIDEVIDALGRV